MANSVDPDQSDLSLPCLLLYLNLSVMLGNYLQQMTSADVIFRMHFFLGALRVKCKVGVSNTNSQNIKDNTYILDH